MKCIVFLDIDGVLNGELIYRNNPKPNKTSTQDEFDDFHFDKERIGWLNEFCEEVEAGVVISSTWRNNPRLESILRRNGATFNIIGGTPYCDCRNRGCEIHKWLKNECHGIFGVYYYDFYRYVIFDDDSDMLLHQASNFFQTDTYTGITPNVLYRAKRFLTHKTF